MLAAHAVTGATTAEWVSAGIALATAFFVLVAIRAVFFTPRARRLAEAVMRGELSPEVDTRLRLLERAIYAAVLIAGIAAALSSFSGVRTVGHALLTSGAIAAAILGFAARQTLANGIAGLVIAVTQPLRLGDQVGFEEHYGVVEDVTLSYTRLVTGSGTRVVIPNEKLASSVLRNDSLMDAPVVPDVSVWIAPDADAELAVAALQAETDGDVAVAEVTPDGVRLTVGTPAVSTSDRPGREAELRLRCLRRLHAEGLLPHA